MNGCVRRIAHSPTRLPPMGGELKPRDFKRLPKNGDAFETLIEHLLRLLNCQILLGPGEGNDFGCDILIEGSIRDPSKRERIVVQCKHHAHSGKAVSEADIGFWYNALSTFGATGYLLVTDTRVTKKLISAFSGFTEQHSPQWADAWNEYTLLYYISQYPRLRRVFFPGAVPPNNLPRLDVYVGRATEMKAITSC